MKKIIFFDVETNGLKGSSVLSISAMKIEYNEKTGEMIKLGEYDRFYYRRKGEDVNEKAISVNGLTDDELARRRSSSEISYPETFEEDVMAFYNFCDGAKHFVAHNIRFDRDFIPFKLEYQFDTMIENTDILKLEGRYGNYKWPTLNKCADFYQVKLDPDMLHQSIYDVIVMARVFYKMNKYPKTKSRIERFVLSNVSTSFR